jgi:hypothetical protein
MWGNAAAASQYPVTLPSRLAALVIIVYISAIPLYVSICMRCLASNRLAVFETALQKLNEIARERLEIDEQPLLLLQLMELFLRYAPQIQKVWVDAVVVRNFHAEHAFLLVLRGVLLIPVDAGQYKP